MPTIVHALNLADAFVIAFLVLFAILGMRKGLVMMVTALVSTLGALLAAFLLARPIAAVLAGAGGVFATLREAIREFFLKNAANINQSVGSSIDGLKLPSFLRAPLAEQLDLTAPLTQGAEVLAQSVFRLLLTGIAAVLIFVGVLLLFRLVAGALNAFFTKFAILNAANRTLGLVAGLVNGVVLLLILMAVLGLFSPLLPKFSEGIKSSLIARYFYDFNLFLAMFAKLAAWASKAV
jgi:uncharacterized membrane protein required for colicin V production